MHSLAWARATGAFLLGYAIATVVGFALYTIGALWMWLGMYTVMPLMFVALAFWYLRSANPPAATAMSHAATLALYWIALSFVLDAVAYVVVLPVGFGARPDWAFFVEQSPWIWLSYGSLIATVFVGLAAFRVSRVHAG